MRWAALIFGAVIVGSVLLPWVTVDLGWIEETGAGTDSGWGILSLIMGVICVGLAFLAIPRIKGIGCILAGVLTIIGVIGYWSAVQDEARLLAGLVDISPGVGLYLCVIGASGVIVTGIVQLRQRGGIALQGRIPREISCRDCGTLNPPSDKFCASCGAEVHSMPVQKATPISLCCPKCHSENDPGSKFCQSCGSILSRSKQ